MIQPCISYSLKPTPGLQTWRTILDRLFPLRGSLLRNPDPEPQSTPLHFIVGWRNVSILREVLPARWGHVVNSYGSLSRLGGSTAQAVVGVHHNSCVAGAITEFNDVGGTVPHGNSSMPASRLSTSSMSPRFLSLRDIKPTIHHAVSKFTSRAASPPNRPPPISLLQFHRSTA